MYGPRSMPPALIVSFSSPFTAEDFAGLVASHSGLGLEVPVEEREKPGPQAGLEWLISTAVILFIGKSYFDGILKEIGKDHYHLLKDSTKRLYARLVGPAAPAVTVIGTAGKVSKPRRYSLLFSLLAEADDGLRFKLLIQESASEAEYAATVDAFVDFLDSFHRRTLSPEAISELQKVRVVGKTMPLAYDKHLGRVVPVDPLAGDS